MRKKINNEFEWVKLYKYNICSYNERYDNKFYNLLKENNIEYFNQLDIYHSQDNIFNCTIYVQLEDYEKGIELIKKNGI